MDGVVGVAICVHPGQARYQGALRPEIKSSTDSKALSQSLPQHLNCTATPILSN
jgi:hypothetical protein